jgi:hypothetical protein
LACLVGGLGGDDEGLFVGVGLAAVAFDPGCKELKNVC